MSHTRILFLIALVACGPGESDDTTDSGSEVVEGQQTLDASRFDIHALVSDFSTVDCTLTDGTSTTCHTVTVRNEPAEWGPGCPSTDTEVGGVGFYDPNGTPVLYALDSDLWDLMEADGYDVIDDQGNVNVVVPTGPPGSGGGGGPVTTGSCLDADLVDTLEMVYLIPADPRLSGSTTTVAVPDVPYSGISLDGLPLAPAPPATVMGNMAALPALDPCGGHPEPDGPFHWHLTPHEVNHVLDAQGIRSDVRCSAIAQVSDDVIAYAADGFPVYGSQDSDGTEPSDLDECHGHSTDAGYHYHVSATEAPNNLTCLKGVLASTFLERR